MEVNGFWIGIGSPAASAAAAAGLSRTSHEFAPKKSEQNWNIGAVGAICG
jgi:hypothetical protein